MMGRLCIIFILAFILLPTTDSAAQEEDFINNWEADWSPNGSQIAFSSNRDGDYDIWIMDVDGSNQINLTPDMQDDQSSPIWSPDGRQLVFRSAKNWEENSLWIIKADEHELHQIVSEYGYIGFYSWSPDSKYIAYNSDPYNQPEYWVVKIDGFETQQILPTLPHEGILSRMFWTNEPQPDPQDTVSVPIDDNLYLAFLYYEYMGTHLPCISDVWCLDYYFDSSTIHVTSKEPELDVMFEVEPRIQTASLYPDGHVVFVTRQREVFKLWLLNAITGEINLLLPEEFAVEVYFEPQWSPDGTQILFTWQNNRYTGRDLWLISSDGTNIRNLTCDNTNAYCVRR